MREKPGHLNVSEGLRITVQLMSFCHVLCLWLSNGPYLEWDRFATRPPDASLEGLLMGHLLAYIAHRSPYHVRGNPVHDLRRVFVLHVFHGLEVPSAPCAFEDAASPP
ncbi:hypothetical protein RhiLY_07695 [Ceratobasidium sp. AG-Ba]|nr:hypothetical protein RhiLY_07695 [Ceratobasidium sp. AG-Ba]